MVLTFANTSIARRCLDSFLGDALDEDTRRSGLRVGRVRVLALRIDAEEFGGWERDTFFGVCAQKRDV